LLDQLASLEWGMIDQGPGIFTDPPTGIRTSFREVIIEGVFRQSLNNINRADAGQPWLSDKQISDLIEDILNQPSKSLVEANEAGNSDIHQIIGRSNLRGHRLSKPRCAPGPSSSGRSSRVRDHLT
jgi:hypothetical protein